MGCCGCWWCEGGGVSYLCNLQQQCLAGHLLPFEWQHLAVGGHSTSPVYFNSFFLPRLYRGCAKKDNKSKGRKTKPGMSSCGMAFQASV